jgi:hypothetical protein
MAKKISEAKTNSDKLRDSLIKFNQIGQAFQSAMSGLQNISNVLQIYANANAVQIEAEAKLANNMRNTMNAREADI